jgi:hypothetical protein
MPQVIGEHSTLNQCQEFLVEFAEADTNVNIQATLAGRITAVKPHTKGELSAVCIKNNT